MNDNQKKKPWSKPEVRRLAVTEELLNLFARATRDKVPPPVRQTK